MTMAVKLTEENLEQIARYLADRFPVLKVRGGGRTPSRPAEMELMERMVRVEEELKNQRDLMREMMIQIDKRFDQVDKRFEMNDKRFEDINSRFTMMMWFIGIGFTLMTAFLTGSMAFFR